MASIILGGREYTVQPPASFAEREDVVNAWVAAGKSQAKTRRTYGAVIGLCYPEIAKAAGVDWAASDYDAVKFGGAVYDHLRGLGASLSEVGTAAGVLLGACLESLSPRQAEVEAKAGFTDRPAGTLTAGP